MATKYYVYYRLEQGDKVLRVYRLDNQILLAINQGTDQALDFEIPKDQIAKIGRALVTAWEDVKE